ncbi:hypothetical protein IC229_33545 [Spirosoma sp. BT702]|uniref:Uncharacterized protein n=1 Tax=Spirosoma profusum TaxID=2771354 RepID=A0A927AWD0_9BACT|nr:hypothetical protein [Spirosoma profusum]MBD2705581.1 hypothetical protein [Spirosoma profusum]
MTTRNVEEPERVPGGERENNTKKMKETTEEAAVTPQMARIWASEAQKENLKQALKRVEQEARRGFHEVILFDFGLDLEMCGALMGMGFSVSRIVEPALQRELIRISW